VFVFNSKCEHRTSNIEHRILKCGGDGHASDNPWGFEGRAGNVDEIGMGNALKAVTGAAAAVEADRRRSERTPHVVEAWIVSPTATRADERREVRALNLSRHGVGFEIGAAMPVGSFFVVEIGVGEQRLRSEVRIISCRRTETGAFEIGAEFC